MVWSTAVPIALALTLGGCGAIGAIGVPFGRDEPRPTAQQSAQPIQTSELPPLTGTSSDATARNPYPDIAGGPQPGSPMATGVPTGTGMGYPAGTTGFPNTTGVTAVPGADPALRGADGQTVTAALPPANQGAELKRTDLLGGWTVALQSDSCQLFMTLTSWTGGYRASTRGCASEQLKSISAWNLNGSQVVLAGQGGSPVATLQNAGGTRFDGQISGGGPVSFYR